MMPRNDAPGTHRERRGAQRGPAPSWPSRVHPAASAGAAVLAFATMARASGFAVPRVGDPHGHPALANPYALHFNPGALGGIRGTQVLVDGSLAYRTVDVTRAASALSPSSPALRADESYVNANTGAAHAGNVMAVPFIAAVSDFGSRSFFAGVGAYMPFGGSVQFDERDDLAGNSALRGAVDGSQRWSVISGELVSLYSTLVLGVRHAESGLSFAVGTSVVWSRVRHVQARNSTGFDDTSTEGRALLEAAGTNLALSAGLYWDVLPQDGLRIGLSYAVRPGLGEVRMNGTLRQLYGTSDAGRAVEFRQSYPDVIRFGIASRVSRTVELRYDADYTTWSVLDQQCIVARGAPCRVNAAGSEESVGAGQIVLALRRRWRDTGAMRVGVGFFADERSELYASAGYETSAVPAATLEPTYPDAFKWIGSIGARRRVTDLLALGLSTTLVAYVPTTATGQQQAALVGASKTPNADGTYRSRVLFVDLNATFSF